MTLVELVRWLVQHGPTLFLGTTVVLLAGGVAMLASRSPDQRRRLGLLTALGTSLYLVLGAVPLPRVPWPSWFASSPIPRSDAAGAALLPFIDPQLRAAALQQALADVEVDPTPALPQPALPLPTAAPAAIAWPTLFASAYLLGVTFFLLRHLVGKARLRQLLATCTEAAAVPGFEMPRGARLLLSPHRVRPFCTGVLRPVIVLPNELMHPDRRAEARAVLAHEASHLRAGDSRVSALLALLAIPLYCHPLFWWLCREVRFCNELLADDDAAGPDRNSYARALLDLAEHDQPVLAAAGTVAVFHRPSEFYRRIQMLLQRRGSLSSPRSRLCRATHALAALCFVGTVAGVFGTPAAAQEPKERAARNQREAELRDTIAALRAEIQELRSLMQVQQATPPSPTDPTLGWESPKADAKTPADLRSLAERLKAPYHAQPLDTWSTDGRLLQRNNRTPNAPAPPDARPYRVKKGDSLERIAERELGNPSLLAEILRLNPNLDPGSLRVGQKILLPSAPPDQLPEPTLESVLRFTPEAVSQDLPPSRDPLSKGDALFNYPQRSDSHLPPGRGMPTDAPSPANATEELTSRYLDLQGEIEIAEGAATEAKTLADTGQGTQREARKATVNLRTLQKKFNIVQRLLDGEIAATEAEVAWLTHKIDATDEGDRAPLTIQRDRAHTRLEAMRAVK